MFIIVASRVLSENITLIIKCIKEFELTELAEKFMEIRIITGEEMEDFVKDVKKNTRSYRMNDIQMKRLLRQLERAVSLSLRPGEIFLWLIKTLKDYDTVASQEVARKLEAEYKKVNIMIFLLKTIFSHSVSQNHRILKQALHFSYAQAQFHTIFSSLSPGTKLSLLCI